MRIFRVTLLPLDIPFVEQFAHATKTRHASDTLLLKLEAEGGGIGWGETLVRPYLSGETVALTFSAMAELEPRLAGIEWRLDFAAATSEARLRPLTQALDALLAALPLPTGVRAWAGLRCALELAILDVLLRAAGKGLDDLLPPVRKELVYSGVISAEDPEKSLKIARQLKQLGIQHYKLKVTPGTAIDVVRSVRDLIGSAARLRLDANASFSLEEAAAFCRAAEPLDVAAIEEPLRAATPVSLASLQSTTTIPIMVDEALVTLADAATLIEHRSARMFNVRLAKCGGVAPCLALSALAETASINLQLGALVGETAILSAVGRALAASSERFHFVEGSYGTLLLKEDIGRQSVRFGHGGRAPLLRGVGNGVDVDEAIVCKYLATNAGPR